jgi:hypothetical protein
MLPYWKELEAEIETGLGVLCRKQDDLSACVPEQWKFAHLQELVLLMKNWMKE